MICIIVAMYIVILYGILYIIIHYIIMFSIIMYKTTLLLGIPHNIRTCAIVVRVSTGGLRMI